MYIENNFKSTTLTSDTKYKDIEAIEFAPIREVKLENVARKGQRKFWKWFGIIPLIPYKVRHNRYSISGHDSWILPRESSTIDEIKQTIVSYSYHYFFDNDDRLFRQAEVRIIYYNPNRTSEYKYFNTNHQAMDYFDAVKCKCKEVGNELK